MLVNPETLRITAVLDFEFTNAMPAQFTYDPPWWLLLSGPEMWLDRCAMEEFLALYEPRMEQFLQALERVEEESTLMRNGLIGRVSPPGCVIRGGPAASGLTMQRGRVLRWTQSIGPHCITPMLVLNCLMIRRVQRCNHLHRQRWSS